MLLLRPPEPAIGVSNKDLAQIDHLVGDPADGIRTNHIATHLQGAALGQRLGRIPYAVGPYVATRLQGFHHKHLLNGVGRRIFARSRKNYGLSLRYFPSWRSRTSWKLGHRNLLPPFASCLTKVKPFFLPALPNAGTSPQVSNLSALSRCRRGFMRSPVKYSKWYQPDEPDKEGPNPWWAVLGTSAALITAVFALLAFVG